MSAQSRHKILSPDSAVARLRRSRLPCKSGAGERSYMAPPTWGAHCLSHYRIITFYRCQKQ